MTGSQSSRPGILLQYPCELLGRSGGDGLLRANARRVAFDPSEKGACGRTLLLDTLTSVVVSAGDRPRLQLTAATDGEEPRRLLLLVENPLQALSELSRVWVQAKGGNGPVTGPQSSAAMNRWRAHIAPDVAGDVAFAEEVIYFPDPATAEAGLLVLSDPHMLFLPHGPASTGAAPVELTIWDEEAPGKDDTIRIKSGDRHHVFLLRGGKPSCDDFWLRLRQLREQRTQDNEEQAGARYACMMMRGPVGIKGELATSSTHMTFTPSSGLARGLLRVGPVSMLLRDVISMRSRRLANPSLVVSSKHAEDPKPFAYTFYHRTPAKLVTDIGPLWAEALLRGMPGLDDQGRLEPADVEQELERWGISKQPVLLAGMVIHASTEDTSRRGKLVLTDRALAFLPGEGPAMSNPVITPTRNVRPAPMGRSHEGWLFVAGGAQPLRFLPVGGQAFCNIFWSTGIELLKVEPGGTGEFRAADPELPRLLGQADFIRVSREGRPVMVSKPARLVALLDGLGLVSPRPAKEHLTVGDRLTMEVATPTGLYRFITRLRRIGRTSGPKKEPLYVVRPPEDMVFSENRRGTFRVRVKDMVHVLPEAEQGKPALQVSPSGIPCEMHDLSTEGCSFFHTQPFSPGVWVTLNMWIDKQLMPLRAEIVSVTQPWGDKWLHGCRFLGLTPGKSNKMSHWVRELQRRSSTAAAWNKSA